MSISVQTQQKKTMWLSEHAKALGISHSHFNSTYLSDEGLICNTAEGRGTVYFFTANKNSTQVLVLRHYWRGGLMAKVSKDSFLFTKLTNTRSIKELTILITLQDAKVNVPTPIAASISREGLLYSADIITSAVPNSAELHEHLQLENVHNEIWGNIGTELKKMHDSQVCHYDVNVKNILLSKQKNKLKVYLLDFDKCELKTGDGWKLSNLARFKRSILKQQQKYPLYHFSEENWQVLLNAYHSHSSK